MRALACLVPLLLISAGCFAPSGASPQARTAVLVQASRDFDCDQQDIRVQQKLGGQYVAFGCGHRVVYNTACEGLQCTVAEEGKSIPWRSRPDPDSNIVP
ncbi:MAG: hypothetical protein ABI193_13665 [Minicystis sp.]